MDNRELTARLLRWSVFLLVLGACAYIFATSVAECLWGHLRAGLDMAAAGHVILHDPYSYTADIPWIDHEWLFEVMLAQAYKSAGIVGINLLKLAASEALVGLLFIYALWCSLPIISAATVVLLEVLLLGPFLFAPRPHLFSAVFFALTLILLSLGENKSRRFLLLLPLLFVPWCNIHGGFVAGLGVVIVWCAADTLRLLIEGRTWRRLFSRHAGSNIALCVAAVLAVFVNPYGIKLPLFLWQTLSVPRPEIPDWRPIDAATPIGAMYIGIVLCTLFLLIKSSRPKTLPSMAVLLISAIQPFAAMRHVMFGMLALLIIGTPHLADVVKKYSRGGDSLLRLPLWQQRVFAAACGIAFVGLSAASAGKLTRITASPALPRQAVAFIKDSGVTGNMAIPFDWGDYCIWHLWPRIKVNCDWRRETAYSNRELASNIAFTYGVSKWDDLLTRQPTDIVLTSPDYATYNLMMLSKGWQICYQDSLCAVFAKKGSALAARLLSTKLTDSTKLGLAGFWP
ncbi:MAG TPA: hypothetical protein V6D22_00165 [Candidatus Obscuribacterales bacterium]